MAYMAPFIKFRMEGHFGATGVDKKELWSAGLNIASSSVLAPGTGTLLSFLTGCSSAVSVWHASSGAKAGSNTFLDSLSAALIGTNGHYQGGSLQATTRYTYASPVAGSGAIVGPWSQALAWSLRSAILRGPGSHGRCFYPCPALTIVPDTGVLNAGTAQLYLTGVITLINAINSAAATSLATATNVSNVSPLGTGFQSPVTRVGIGARLDTQESRERSMPEAYQFGNTAISSRVLEETERDYLDYLKTLPDYQDRP